LGLSAVSQKTPVLGSYSHSRSVFRVVGLEFVFFFFFSLSLVFWVQLRIQFGSLGSGSVNGPARTTARPRPRGRRETL